MTVEEWLVPDNYLTERISVERHTGMTWAQHEAKKALRDMRSSGEDRR